MKTKALCAIVVLLLLGPLVDGSLSFGGDIKARMKERLPAIKALKASGAVGENNQGYLECLRGNRDDTGVVSAENADRKIVYTAIAKQQRTTPEVVGKRRALQIAERAAAGEWLQDAAGAWYQAK